MDYLNLLINEQLVFDQHSLVYEEKIEVDYQLVGEGVVMTSQYISLLLDGTFHCINDQSFEGSHRSQTRLPFYTEGMGPFQVYVSEYTATTFLKAVESVELLTIDTKLPS